MQTTSREGPTIRKIDNRHHLPRVDLIDPGAVVAATTHALSVVLDNETIDYGTLTIAFSVGEEYEGIIHVSAMTPDETGAITTDGRSVLDRLVDANRDARRRFTDAEAIMEPIARSEADLAHRRNRLLREVDDWPWWARGRARAVRDILIGGDE